MTVPKSTSRCQNTKSRLRNKRSYQIFPNSKYKSVSTVRIQSPCCFRTTKEARNVQWNRTKTNRGSIIANPSQRKKRKQPAMRRFKNNKGVWINKYIQDSHSNRRSSSHQWNSQSQIQYWNSNTRTSPIKFSLEKRINTGSSIPNIMGLANW